MFKQARLQLKVFTIKTFKGQFNRFLIMDNICLIFFFLLECLDVLFVIAITISFMTLLVTHPETSEYKIYALIGKMVANYFQSLYYLLVHCL